MAKVSPPIAFGTVSVGSAFPPFIVAEMSGNHNRSLDRALAIVDAAAHAGVHALKLQTYTASTMTLDIHEREFVISDPKSLWKGEALYSLYEKASTPWEWHQPIFERCRRLGLLAFSSPFDKTAVDFLETLEIPAYKIASFEITDIPLIRRVARTGKPVIISTGMALDTEIQEAVDAVRQEGSGEVILLKCTSTYPASPNDSNLRTLPEMERRFGCLVGLSDHTVGSAVSVASVALGACMIERHFTLSRDEGGVDAAFSLEPAEMSNLVRDSREAWQALGQVFMGPTENEEPALLHRRSLYVTRDMLAGEVFSEESVRAIRPGLGLPPKHLSAVLGLRASRDIQRGTPLSWELIER